MKIKFEITSVLFWLGFLLYAFIRVYKISHFPLGFFTDEVFYPNMANKFIENSYAFSGIVDVFFQKASSGRWVPNLVTYIYVLPILFFGKSTEVVRLIAALISLVVPISVSIMLRQIYKLKFWWLYVLVLSAIPTWFFHSRTGFEVVFAVSFYSLFLVFYTYYRNRSRSFLFLAVIFAMMSFYSYTNAQLVVGATTLLLVISDLRYHLKSIKSSVAIVILFVLLLVPVYLQKTKNPQTISLTLKTINSYLYSRELDPKEKLIKYAHMYSYALGPNYWALHYRHDLDRHLYIPYGLVRVSQYVFFLIGLAYVLRRVFIAKFRTILLFLIMTPVSSSLVNIGITGVMFFIVPFSILTIFGINQILIFINKKPIQSITTTLLLVYLVVVNIRLPLDALKNSKNWYKDFGFYGLQWGARELFEEEIPKYLASNPTDIVHVGSDWTNDPLRFVEFYYYNNKAVEVLSAQALLNKAYPLKDNSVFIVTEPELDKLKESKFFSTIITVHSLNLPNNKPGFFFIKPKYVPNVSNLFLEKNEQLRKPQLDNTYIKNQNTKVLHSPIVAGVYQMIFDGVKDESNYGIFGRNNPAFLEIDFENPTDINSLSIMTPYKELIVKAVYTNNSNISTDVYKKFNDANVTSLRSVNTSQIAKVKKLKIEISVLTQIPQDEIKIQINEIEIK